MDLPCGQNHGKMYRFAKIQMLVGYQPLAMAVNIKLCLND